MSTYLHLHDTRLHVQNFNNDFLLLRGKTNAKIAEIGTAIFQHQFDFVEEVIVTEVEICIKLNHRFHPVKIGLLSTVKLANTSENNRLKLPVYFHDHEDWKMIESYTKRSRRNVIEALAASNFTVAMFGFLPGFTYFNGLDKSLQIPRKSVPAKYVPANSLAIGGKYLGLYSIASPGGWCVIGRIPLPILDLSKLPPVAFKLGDCIKLESIDKSDFDQLSRQQISLKSYNHA